MRGGEKFLNISFQVLEKSGHTVKLSWQAPYNGNSNLTRYVIEFKPSKGTWKNDIDHVLVPGDQVSFNKTCFCSKALLGHIWGIGYKIMRVANGFPILL